LEQSWHPFRAHLLAVGSAVIVRVKCSFRPLQPAEKQHGVFFIRFVKTVPVSFVDCTLWAFAPLLGSPVEALHHEHVQPNVEQS
jgi:hypothetical protein